MRLTKLCAAQGHACSDIACDLQPEFGRLTYQLCNTIIAFSAFFCRVRHSMPCSCQHLKLMSTTRHILA